ncbi:MAG TPA: hypothetical protein VFW87_19325, partial [Pirellulales bacterium]|nr:hypothetical protein [Pirellulales bacterium]
MNRLLLYPGRPSLTAVRAASKRLAAHCRLSLRESTLCRNAFLSRSERRQCHAPQDGKHWPDCIRFINHCIASEKPPCVDSMT